MADPLQFTPAQEEAYAQVQTILNQHFDSSVLVVSLENPDASAEETVRFTHLGSPLRCLALGQVFTMNMAAKWQAQNRPPAF